MFRAPIIRKALHSAVTGYFRRRPATLGSRRGGRGEVCRAQLGARGAPTRRAWRPGFWPRARAARCRRAPCLVPPLPARPIGRRAGGGAAGAGPVPAPQGSAHVRRTGGGGSAGACGFPARRGAADVASRRRGGGGRVPGVPEVRRPLRGARRPGAGPVPVAAEALMARAGAWRPPLGVPESVPGLVGEACPDCRCPPLSVIV